MAENTQALRKRQQIENAGKNMFIWVAGAAAIVGIAAVLSLSLVERITFKQGIINLKNETVDHLQKNNKIASQLKDGIRVLNTNEALLTTPRLDKTQPVSVILDALPSSANSSALGASLQQKLLNVSGVSIESLTIEPVAGVENINSDAPVSVTSSENEIIFKFSVNAPAGQASKLQEVLRNLERSIRTIDVTGATIEQQGSSVTLTVNGKAFYQPATKVELKEESKTP